MSIALEDTETQIFGDIQNDEFQTTEDHFDSNEALGSMILQDIQNALADKDFAEVIRLSRDLEKHYKIESLNMEFLLAECRFDPEKPPLSYPAVVKLNGTPIASVGNLIAFSGQSKSGKSHGLAAIISSALAELQNNFDFLGFECPNPDKKALIYIDAEQSKEDFYKLMSEALKRANINHSPDWFYAFHLTGKEPELIIHAIEEATQKAEKNHSGTLLLLIDGYADLVNSPNDENECFHRVRLLMELAEKIQAPIIGVLHHNPGNELKMRGHLGSQIERKSQTVITFKKSKEIITAYTTQSRGVPIPENLGSNFAWNIDAGMFLSVKNNTEVKKTDKEKESRELAIDAMQSDTEISYTELLERLMELTGNKKSSAQKKVAALRKEGFLKQDSGMWKLGDKAKNHD